VIHSTTPTRSHLGRSIRRHWPSFARILEAPSTDRTEILRALMPQPASADLAALLAMADTDEVVRLQLLAIRGLGV
jgi:hypothetical protein